MQQAPDSVLAGYMSAKEAATDLKVHPFTLRRWRSHSYGPKPVRVGGRLYYRRIDIQNWLQKLAEEQQGDIE